MRAVVATLLVLILLLGTASSMLLYQRAERSEDDAVRAREAALNATARAKHPDEGAHTEGRRAPAGSAEAALQAENELLRQEAAELAELLHQIKRELEQAQAAAEGR